MPRLSSSTHVAAGVAAQVSIDRGIVHPRGTAVCWLTPTRILFNALISEPGAPEQWALRTFDITTGAFGEVPHGERGANAIAAAGGGKWLAWLAGVGVYDAAGNVWPAAGLAGPTVSGDGRGAAGRDGSLAMVADRGNGRELLLYPPSGPAIALPDIAIGKLTIESASVVIWTENNQAVAWGVPSPAPQLDPVFSAQSIWTGRERLLLVTGYDRLWLRKWSAPLGYLVVPTPTAFSADAIALSPDLVRVSWSRTAGEGPGDIQWLDVAVADLVQPVEPPTPPDPEPPDPPDPEPPDPEPPDPVPPDPEPEPPEPEPPLPEAPHMLTIDLTTPLIRAVTGEKVVNDDGTVSVKCPDGYLSIDSAGAISFKPDIGSDEKFQLSGSALIATNTFDGVKTWMLPCAETTS